MRLAQPPGIRSTLRPNGAPGEGGTWDFAVREHGGKVIHVEFEELLGRVSKSDRESLRQELRDKLHAAQAGQLLYGPSSSDDVCLMEIVGDVLELRLDDVNHWDEQCKAFTTRHIRLYFSEPASHLRLLVGICLRTKVPGPPGLEEQNAHAQEASKLATEHGLKVGLL